MKKVVCQSDSADVTQAFARKLVFGLFTGGLILLKGELGAGKTTFVQGLANALGVSSVITSPTFTLLNIYPTHHHLIRQLVHVDLYRLSSSADTKELDLPSWLERTDVLMVVEWPESAMELWTNQIGTITFRLGETMNHRILEIDGQIAAVFGATD